MSEAHIAYANMGPWPVYVGFTKSRKAFGREMKRLAIKGVPFLAPDHANASTHFLEHGGALTCIITLGSTKDRSIEQIASLIAHEAVHVAQEVWSSVGETKPGREAEAYLVQHVTQHCLQIALDTGRTKKEAP